MKKKDDSREHFEKVTVVTAAVLMAAAAFVSGIGAFESILSSFSTLTVSDGMLSNAVSIDSEQLPMAALIAVFSAAAVFVSVKQLLALIFAKRIRCASFAAYTGFWALYIGFFSLDKVYAFLLPSLYLRYRFVPLLNINLMQFRPVIWLLANNLCLSRLVIIIGFIIVTAYRSSRSDEPHFRRGTSKKPEKAIDKN